MTSTFHRKEKIMVASVLKYAPIALLLFAQTSMAQSVSGTKVGLIQWNGSEVEWVEGRFAVLFITGTWRVFTRFFKALASNTEIHR
jgi:hypothetical protein